MIAVLGHGDAEVEDLHRAVVGDEDVVRRDVAVDDVERPPVEADLLVRVVEARGDAHDHVERVLHRHAPARRAERLAHAAHVLAVEVLHGDEGATVGLAHVVHLRQVGVIQRRRDPRLVEEHPHEVGVGGELREDALDDADLLHAGDAGGASHPDLGHAADGDLLEELIFAERDGLHEEAPGGALSAWGLSRA